MLIYTGNVFDILPTMGKGTVHTCVTSPPYFGLRDYGADGQIGLEQSPQEYVDNLVRVFRLVRDALRDDGTLWLNLGDTYATGTTAERQQSKNAGVGANHAQAQNSVRRVGTPNGIKTKDLIGIPWRVAFALQQDGWYLRSDIIWHKPNAMPESVRDRPTKSHEYIFLMSKSERYYYDAESIKENAVKGSAGSTFNTGKSAIHQMNRSSGKERIESDKRNKRTVWTVATKPFKGAHFATFPPELIEPCILAGCPEGGTVLDPFFGSGTTGAVAQKRNRDYIGIELNPEYVEIAKARIEAAVTARPLDR